MELLALEALNATLHYVKTRWLESYRKYPFLTAFLTFFAIAIIGIVIFFVMQAETRRQAEIREAALATLDLQTQVNELIEIEKNLEELITFVGNQQEKIELEQNRIASLEEVRAELEPLVEADQEVVDALLAAQDRAAARSRWSDIAIGFAGGFISEIIVAIALAPILIPKLEQYLQRKREEINELESSDTIDSTTNNSDNEPQDESS